MNKWYTTAAVSGSGFEDLADKTVAIEELNNEFLKSIDLLFIKNIADFHKRFKLYQYIALSDEPVSVEEQEKFILANPGTNFISRVGHDIINLLTPLEQLHYLEQNIIDERVELGLKLGRQINIIGHLTQNTRFCEDETTEIPIEDLIYNITSFAKKKEMELNIDYEYPDNKIKTVLCRESILNIALDQIMENCRMYTTGGIKLKIEEPGKMIFSNPFKGELPSVRTKATLRWPFMKSIASKGNGMGLFILSIASVKGGFSWDIEIKENIFSLSLSF